MFKVTKYPFKLRIVVESGYHRLYVSHKDMQGRIKKHIGRELEFEEESLLAHLKVDLEKYFSEKKIIKDEVQNYLDQLVDFYISKKFSLFTYFDDFLETKKTTINRHTKNRLVPATITAHQTTRKHFEDFIKKQKISGHHSKINKALLDSFYEFLPCGHNTKVKYHTRLKEYIKYLIKNKDFNIDKTFADSKFCQEYDNLDPKEDDIALTTEQVKTLIELRNNIRTGDVSLEYLSENSNTPDTLVEYQKNKISNNLKRSLDCYLFMISFGMYYADVMKSKIIITKQNREPFLKYKRAKNGSLCKAFPLITDEVFIGAEIIKEYKIQHGQNFPLNLSLDKFDKHLDRIGKLAGFDFKLLNKMARKTFASELYFERETPIYMVQTLLGHKNVKETMHYLRIEDDNLASKMKKYMFQEAE